MTASLETQIAAIEAAVRYWRGSQSGPKPASKEAKFLADLLIEAAASLRQVAEKMPA